MKASDDVLAAVLAEFELPEIEERIPRARFDELGLRFPQQYAIAARDVLQCVRRAEALGAGPFLHAMVPALGWVERGQPVRGCRLEVALGYAGGVQLEVLGPGRGTEHYARALVGSDVAFHHVGVYQRGMHQLSERLIGAGYPEAVRGGISLGKALSFDFRYFDTRDDYGIYIEVLDFQALGRELDLEPLIRAYAKLARWRRSR